MKKQIKSDLKDRYLANGRMFNSLEEVESYASENGWRITNTEIIRKGLNLISLNK